MQNASVWSAVADRENVAEKRGEDTFEQLLTPGEVARMFPGQSEDGDSLVSRWEDQGGPNVGWAPPVLSG